MPNLTARIFTLILALHISYSVFADQDWDSQANIKAAVLEFKGLQDSQGNEEVVQRTTSCYAAVRATGPSKELEYCIAFDAANIEMTTAFYEGLAKRYKKTDAASLQPPETTRSIGRNRIVSRAARAKLSNPLEYSQSIYGKATRTLVEIVLQPDQPAQQ